VNRLEIRLSGFGGQGIVRSGEIVGKAASLYDGRFATFTQSYGPESRGGACAAQVAIADDPVELSYPHVIDPTVLVVMSQGGYNKYVPDFRRDGLLITDEDLVSLDQAAEGLQVLSIPATRLAEGLGRRIVANVVMLGFVAAVTDIASADALKRAVIDSVPKGTEELNEKAFDTGFEYGQENTPDTPPAAEPDKPKKSAKKKAKGKDSK
jgi:2-oxoglutarate ferredoxin oxidoreductase subunit gamma